MKFEETLIEKKDIVANFVNKCNEQIYVHCNKNKYLSKRLHIIPGTMGVRFGSDGADFTSNLVTVIVEHKTITLRELRRSKRNNSIFKKHK